MSETNSIKDLIVEEDVNVNVGDSLLVGPDGPVGPEGPQGPEGKSAYEVAVENGFTGTEEDWLASLKATLDPDSVGTDELKDEAVTPEKTNFTDMLIKKNSNILNLQELITDKAIQLWSTSSLTTSNYLVDRVGACSTKPIKVEGGNIYKSVQKNSISTRTFHCAQFDSNGSCIKYEESLGTFVMLENTQYVAFSFLTSNVIPDGIVKVSSEQDIPIYSEYGYSLDVVKKEEFNDFKNLENVTTKDAEVGKFINVDGTVGQTSSYTTSYFVLKKGETVEIGALAETNVSILSVTNETKDTFKSLISGEGISYSENWKIYKYTNNSNQDLYMATSYNNNVTHNTFIKKYFGNEYYNVINNLLGDNINLSLKHEKINTEYLISMFNNIACIGDSITEGVLNANRGMANTPYPKALEHITGISCNNYGHAGTTPITYWNNNYLKSIDFSSIDCAIIELGTNGSMTDTLEEDTQGESYEDYANTNTGCYCKIIEYIKGQNSNIKMFLCNVWWSGNGGSDTTTTNKVIKEISEKYNLPLLDIYKNDFYPLDYHDLILHPWYSEGGDILHFSEIGYTILAKVILYCITNYIYNNMDKYLL